MRLELSAFVETDLDERGVGIQGAMEQRTDLGWSVEALDVRRDAAEACR
jgi:hypothetical protein